jgi:hypothetical protein
MTITATEKPFRVGVYRTANQAARAIEGLLAAGLSKNELAVVCSDKCGLRFKDIPQPKPDNAYSAEAIGIGTAAGAILGGLTLAVATAATGGVAPLAAGGTVLIGGGAIAGAFVGAMSRPIREKELGPYFEQAVRPDSILVAAEAHGAGSAEKLARAEKVLAETGGEPLALPEG